MPPRKRPARTQIYRDDAENPPPSKKMRKSVLAEKPVRNFSSVGDTSKAASAKRKLTSKEGDSIDKSKKEARGGKRARKETTEGHVEKSDRELTAEVNPPHQPPTLYDEVVSHLRSAQLSHKFALPSSTSPDEIAEAITAKRLWTPALLCLFRSHPVTILKLTLDSNLPYSDPTPLLQPFWAIDVFTHLTTLSLSAIPLTIDSLSLISRLPSITHLDLAKTGINTDALCYMIIHRRTLKSLNLSGNSQIDDDARVTLRTLSGLIKLNLHGTSFTMPGLRRLVTDMEARTQLSMPPSQDPLNPQPQRPPIHLVGIPTACMDALKKPTYFKQIPNGYAKDPDLVANLDLSSLKRNINLHATENSGMSKSGNKKELVKSLRAVLEARRGDERVERAVNGPGTAEG